MGGYVNAFIGLQKCADTKCKMLQKKVNDMDRQLELNYMKHNNFNKTRLEYVKFVKTKEYLDNLRCMYKNCYDKYYKFAMALKTIVENNKDKTKFNDYQLKIINNMIKRKMKLDEFIEFNVRKHKQMFKKE